MLSCNDYFSSTRLYCSKNFTNRYCLPSVINLSLWSSKSNVRWLLSVNQVVTSFTPLHSRANHFHFCQIPMRFRRRHAQRIVHMWHVFYCFLFVFVSSSVRGLIHGPVNLSSMPFSSYDGLTIFPEKTRCVNGQSRSHFRGLPHLPVGPTLRIHRSFSIFYFCTFTKER